MEKKKDTRQKSISEIKLRSLNVNGIGQQKKRDQTLKKLSWKNDDFIILVDTRLKSESLKKVKNTWTGNIHSSNNERLNSSGGILILTRRGLDVTPKESGKDKANLGRMAWEIYEMRGHRILIMGVYGPPGGGEDIQNAIFFEEEVFEVLDNETYDNVIIAGDWNVFLDPDKDQKDYKLPGKYRTKTREEIKSKMRTHNLSDIYREQNPTKREFTYKAKTGNKISSRLDYFIVDQEAAINTTKAAIEPIADPFDHSEITITVDFDKIMRGPGFWKFNNSHLENTYSSATLEKHRN